MDAAKRELTATRTKLLYGVGAVAFGIKDNGFQTILLLFYNQVIGLPAQLVGAAIMVALMIDAFLDPVVGQISDNLRTRWGRRHPFMYAAALPVAVSYLLLWNPPHWSQSAMFFYLVAVAVIVRTFITCFEIPSAALAPELSDDYDQRTSFISFRIFFGWYGGVTMLALAYLVFLVPDATHTVGQLNEAGYSRYGLTAAVIMFAAIMISALGTHKFIPHFRAAPDRKISILQYAREMLTTMKNRAFLILMSAALLTYLATGLVFALNIYLQTYFWELSHTQIFILTIPIFLAVLQAFLVAPALSRRFGKKKGAIALFLVGFVISSAPLVLRLIGWFPANGAPSLVPVLFVFAAIGLAMTVGSSILTISMLSDIVEDSELKTGRRSEGLFFAGASFLQKAASGLGLFVSGLMLRLVDFPVHATPGQVDPQIVRNLVLVYLPTLLILYGSAMAIISRFPITREHHQETLRRLAEETALAAAPVATDLEMDLDAPTARMAPTPD